jgi:hypothetical protein
LVLGALLIAVDFAASNVSVGAAPSTDPLLKYFSGSWTCKITKSSHPKNIGVRFSYSGVRHGKSLVWTYDDGSSGSEVYDPRLRKYLWLGANGDDGSYDASMSSGWIGNTSKRQVVLASWPQPLGIFLVTRISDTRYTEGYQLHGITKGEYTCTKR